MRMPRTSSFSVRDILDLGPKQGKEGGEDAGTETKLPPVKTEPKPDLVKTAACQSSPRCGVVSSSTQHYFPGPHQGLRPPPHLAQWSNISPFLSYNKCRPNIPQPFPLFTQIFLFQSIQSRRRLMRTRTVICPHRGNLKIIFLIC